MLQLASIIAIFLAYYMDNIYTLPLIATFAVMANISWFLREGYWRRYVGNIVKELRRIVG